MARPFLRGNANAIVQHFAEVDPVTQVETPYDPTIVIFTLVAPDGTETMFQFGVEANVTNPEVGLYVCTLDPELPVGVYRWAAEGSGGSSETYEARYEDWFPVEESSIEPADGAPVPVMGPCSQWISGNDVAQCARVDYDGSNAYVFDEVAYNASLALYEISQRQFPGICERAVRPCRDGCGCWLGGPLSYGMGPWFWTSVPWGFGGWGWYNERGDSFGCAPMSRVRLAGYPVVEVVSVTLDGAELPELDPDTGDRNWRLDKWRYLVRMDAPGLDGAPAIPRFWPSCQNMSLDADQPGTFAVTYRWGTDVPQLGRSAAVEIANQLYLACGGRECVLPAGVTRAVRQGIEIDRGLLANWLDPAKETGLVQLDLFLQAYCQGGRRGRKSALWSPDMQQFARRVGTG